MRIAGLIGRLREVARELDCGQRRALEVRTGYVYTPETKRRIARDEVRRLEALYGSAEDD